MASLLRPRASDADKAIFTDLLNKISEADSYFCCGGTIDFHNRPLNLYYKSKGDANTQPVNCLDFLLSRDPGQFKIAVDRLVDACVPAPHGRGNQTVYDDSYRLARELPLGEFSLSLDILGEAGTRVLSTISDLVSGRCHYLPKAKTAPPVDENYDYHYHKAPAVEDDPLSLELEPRLYKLNAYSRDGFFKPHRDTPKGSKHAGTLLFGLPVGYEGGALRVAHAGKEVKFDWGSQCSQGILFTGENDYKISIPWAFFFSDVEHEVFPILSGSRVTIAYDIFASQTTTPESNIDTNIRTFPISDEINSALQNPGFLPEGAKVAMALSHAYPMPRRQLTEDELASNLKGTDAILYHDLKSLGLNVSLEAVYELPAEWTPYGDARPSIPEDGYEPTKLRRWNNGKHYVSDVYYTSKSLAYINNDEGGGEGFDYVEFLENSLGAKFAGDLMWVKKPTGTFTEAGSYMAYSNESTLEHCYSAVTFVVVIPPYGEGSRSQA